MKQDEPLIPGGYILLSRKIIESEIWQKPPLYLKVWIYLLAAAQHRDYKKLKRGQLRTSIPELIEACSWKVGFRTERPSKDQIYQILAWFREMSESANEADTRATTKATMVTTTRATHGMLINIDNYWVYQDPKNYESNNESNDESNNEADTKPDNTNKNDKNVKNDKKINHRELFESYTSNHKLVEALMDFVAMRKEIKKPLSTLRMVNTLLGNLDKLTSDDKTKIDILDQAIFNKWQTVYALKSDFKSTRYERPLTKQDRNKEVLQRHLQDEVINDERQTSDPAIGSLFDSLPYHDDNG